MNLFCPTCESAYAGAAACPKCGGRLITPAEAFALPIDLPSPPPDPIRPTIVARVAIGTIAGLGLYFAARDWATAAALSTGEPVTSWWTGPTGVAVGYALRGLAAGVAGLLAGAGRRSGAVTGLIAGLLLGGVFLAMDTPPGRPVAAPSLGLFAAGAVIAAVAGVAGRRVWPAAAETPLADAGGSRGSSLARLADAQKEFDEANARPTRWFRVVLGSAVAVAGVLYADAFREELHTLTRGSWNLSHPNTVPLVDLSFASVAVIFGGMAAGAATGAGLRHGLIAGGGIALGVVLLAPRHSEGAMKPLTALLDTLDVHPDLSTGLALGTVGLVLVVVAAFTGWLGDQLLPPLAPPSMRSRKIELS